MKEFNQFQHFINSTAKLIQCPKCTGWMYEATVNGWRVRVEPIPLNLSDEIAWRLSNRQIYQTVGTVIDFSLEPRKLWHINKGDKRSLVLGNHDCQFPTIFEPEPLFASKPLKEPNF